MSYVGFRFRGNDNVNYYKNAVIPVRTWINVNVK